MLSVGDDDGNVTKFLKSADVDNLRISSEENPIARSLKNDKETDLSEETGHKIFQMDRAITEIPDHDEDNTKVSVNMRSTLDDKAKKKKGKKTSVGTESSIQTKEDKEEGPRFKEGIYIVH